MATGDRNYDIAKETTSQEILSAVGKGTSVIKSVQRGVISNQSTIEVTVSISTVDPNKCMVILNGGISDIDNSYSQSVTAPYLVSLTNTQLKVHTGAAVDKVYMPVSWQIIEFN